jgi:hypothetical protein
MKDITIKAVPGITSARRARLDMVDFTSVYLTMTAIINEMMTAYMRRMRLSSVIMDLESMRSRAHTRWASSFSIKGSLC